MKQKKKRNKTYSPKPIWCPGRERSVYEEMQELLRRVNLIIELTLYPGKCTNDHIEQIKDFLNWTSVTLRLDEFLDQKIKDEYAVQINAAVELMVKVILRKNSGKYAIFKAGANEVNTIATAAHTAREYMMKQLKLRPKWMHHNFRLMDEYMKYRDSDIKRTYIGTLTDLDKVKGQLEANIKRRELKRAEAEAAKLHERTH